jgi:hypothetical protein
MRACESRNEKPVDPILHRSCQDLAQKTRVARIRSPQTVEVTRAVRLIDHCRGISKPNEKKVEQKASDATVAVGEGVDAFEAGV